MTSHAAPSGGSAPDDFIMQGRMRSKARGSTRAGAPADSALRHGSADTTDLVPELGAQAAAPPLCPTTGSKINLRKSESEHLRLRFKFKFYKTKLSRSDSKKFF